MLTSSTYFVKILIKSFLPSRYPGSGGFCRNELWIDKYKPHSLEELAVRKKKIEEVKVWFEERLRKPKDYNGNNVLVITGPAGVGKSNEMVKYRFIAYGGLSLADFSVVATEYVPALKWLGSSASGDHENLRVLTEENTDFDLVNSGDPESHTSDEEIEDC